MPESVPETNQHLTSHAMWTKSLSQGNDIKRTVMTVTLLELVTLKAYYFMFITGIN